MAANGGYGKRFEGGQRQKDRKKGRYKLEILISSTVPG